MTMSHDHKVFQTMLGKANQISVSLEPMGQSPLVLVCLIRDMGLKKYVKY